MLVLIRDGCDGAGVLCSCIDSRWRLCYNFDMRSRSLLPLSGVCLVVMALLLNLTTPDKIGPFGVLLFFVALFLLVFGILATGVRLFLKIAGRGEFLDRKTYGCVGVFSFVPILLLLAQALSSVNVLAIILIIIFVALGCFLIRKRS